MILGALCDDFTGSSDLGLALAGGGMRTVQFASVLPALRAGGYEGAFGCEYKPKSTVEAGLGWRDPFR